MTQLRWIGVLREDDLSELPAPMLRAVELLRVIAHCGMPYANADGTLTVYLTIVPRPDSVDGEETANRYQRADIDGTGRIMFSGREEN